MILARDNGSYKSVMVDSKDAISDHNRKHEKRVHKLTGSRSAAA